MEKIYVIFEMTHDGTNTDQMLGFVLSEKAATEYIENLDKMRDAWREKHDEWKQALSKFTEINRNRLFQDKLSARRENLCPPDLTRIPKDRHEIVMGNYQKRIANVPNFDEKFYNANGVAIATGKVKQYNEKIYQEFYDIHGEEPEFSNDEWHGGECYYEEAEKLLSLREKK